MKQQAWLPMALVMTVLLGWAPPVAAQFKTFGTAQQDVDPQNPANDVVRITVTPVPFQLGGVFLDLNSSPPISELTNQLSFKYFFTAAGPGARSCGAGTPRVTLFIDANGDGKFVQFPAGPDFAAHGHVNPPAFAGCPAGVWRFEDLTDLLVRWEVTPSNAISPPIGPIGGASAVNWAGLVAAVTTAFPNHQVLSALLVDDSGVFFAAAAGVAFYDLFTVGRRTLQTHRDLSGE